MRKNKPVKLEAHAPSSSEAASTGAPPAKPSPSALTDGGCPSCEGLRATVENQRQAMARLSAPGIERAPWFYAPCANCGAIEGMGLVTAERKRGELLRGYTSVWCCQCEHFGPPIRQEIGKVKENDRAATMAWNAEFAAAFAAGRAALAKARGETPDGR